ncbi:MAG: flagellar motor switch protein FliN [Gammaproteobacteria bacterium]
MSEVEQQADAEAPGDEWADALAEQSAGEGAREDELDSARQAPLEPLRERGGQAREDSSNIEAVLDIPVTLSVEIGATKISIRNLLQLTQGSVVELDRLAGEPLDVLVNGTLVAHGEVVVVNEKFGIRLTDVVSPQERVRKLR